MGSGEMEKWATCREPQGRAIGKIPPDREVNKVNMSIKLSFKFRLFHLK